MTPITTTADLAAFCQKLAAAPFIAVDTEFMRETTFWPRLCLVQVAGPDIAANIDPMAEGLDLGPLLALMADASIQKVFHAGRQDVEIFNILGVIPLPLFDTQIAAMAAGFGEQVAYDALVRQMLKITLDKSSRFTDWARRPLNQAQLEYALADVTHLATLYPMLRNRLEETGRLAWVMEEMNALTDPAVYDIDPENAWKRLKPRTSNKRFLAMLASLAAWREREAQARDIPRGRVLKDEALTEIAAHPPESGEALERIRAVPKGFAGSKLGKGLMDAIEHGRTAAPPPGIEPERARRKREPSPAAIDLLKTLLRLRAEAVGVAPRLIANAEDIERLAALEDDDVAALKGWRNEVFGKDAVALRKGDLAIALDGGEAVVVELED